MATFTKEELLKIAHLSSLKLDEQEIPVFVDQITAILQYVEQLATAQVCAQTEPIRNVNVLRDDIARSTDPEPLLARAPQRIENYFGVPQILEEK
ncbi:Asp-tRNA(Asn)/Glu-tRNA(Gln) amidotransferase subunit GatC [Candidatus Dependentiae bacterium]|nr:Asp-tRNA(Asn)/Glu-tRNA(Gln) amidotransferase subunit GatC [Candidatus Dependentiae bacterium]